MQMVSKNKGVKSWFMACVCVFMSSVAVRRSVQCACMILLFARSVL